MVMEAHAVSVKSIPFNFHGTIDGDLYGASHCSVETYSDYCKIPNSVSWDGKIFYKTGWCSDTGRVFYSTSTWAKLQWASASA